MRNQAGRCGLDEIQYFLEPIGTTVIRVWHIQTLRVGGELEE
jgi:hypothetical protein